MESIRCMVIDDEPLAAQMVRNFVQRTPFLEFVAMYTDAVEALEALKANPVDLLFLDIHMPDLDGMSLAAMVPQHASSSPPPSRSMPSIAMASMPSTFS